MPALSWRFFVYKLFMYKLNEKNMKSKSVLKEEAAKNYVLNDSNRVIFGSSGTSIVDGCKINTKSPKIVTDIQGYRVCLFPAIDNKTFGDNNNKLAGYGVVSKLGGGEVLYPVTNPIQGNGSSYTVNKGFGVRLQQMYFVNDANGVSVFLKASSKNTTAIKPQNINYYFNLKNGRGYDSATKRYFKDWSCTSYATMADAIVSGAKAVANAVLSGTTDSGTTKPTPDERVEKMQAALNAAGYVGKNGKSLAVDGLLGGANSNTRFAAQQAGIDPTKWNGEPITPKQQQQQGQAQQQGQGQAQQQGQQQTQSQQGFDYSNDAAYGKYLGGADARQIKKFQYDFGVEPETGVYDAKTAGKAYELAHDTNDNNFKRAGGNIKAYAEWNAYEAGGNAANTQHAQAAATQTFNTAVQELNAALDKYGKGNPAANERLNNIRNFIKTNNFEGAKQAANSLVQIGPKKNIIALIDKCAGAYAGTQGQQQQAQAVNEIMNTFNTWMNRINSATLLQS